MVTLVWWGGSPGGGGGYPAPPTVFSHSNSSLWGGGGIIRCHRGSDLGTRLRSEINQSRVVGGQQQQQKERGRFTRLRSCDGARVRKQIALGAGTGVTSRDGWAMAVLAGVPWQMLGAWRR